MGTGEKHDSGHAVSSDIFFPLTLLFNRVEEETSLTVNCTNISLLVPKVPGSLAMALLLSQCRRLPSSRPTEERCFPLLTFSGVSGAEPVTFCACLAASWLQA